MIKSIILDDFQRRHGQAPDLLVRAPGRINLIGEHTDYNEGFVLPAAIDKAIFFAFRLRDDEQLSFHAFDLQEHYTGSLRNLTPSTVYPWANYLLGVMYEARRDGLPLQGLDVVFGGDIPLGAGLSSSAAIESGMAFALNHFLAWQLEKPALARLAQRGENNFVGMNCGIMDMFASLLGRSGHALRLDCRSLEYAYFPINLPEHTFVLCDTGVKHALVNSEYNTRRAECEEGVRQLQVVLPHIHSLRDVTPAIIRAECDRLPGKVYDRCLFVAEENQRVEDACVALEQGDLEAFGALLYQSHEGLQHRYEVSCVESDFLVDQTRPDAEVLGARQMGGGFGGCTLNLIRRDYSVDFQKKMQTAYRAAFNRDLVCYEIHITNGVENIGTVLSAC